MRILLVLALLIAYGSLYPGDFTAPQPNALLALLTDWRWFTSLSDVLGNVVLFFPLGVAGALVGRRDVGATRHYAWFFVASIVFSFLLQVTQVWLPSRSAALADVIWNITGVALGVAAGHMMKARSHQDVRVSHTASFIPVAILGLWICAELLPLVPALDWQKIKDALKPLLLEFNLSLSATLLHAAGAMVAGSVLAVLVRRPAAWLAALLVLVLVGKLLIVNLTLDASLIAGFVGAYIGFVIFSRRGAKLFDVAFWLLLAAWSIAVITPFSPAPGGVFNPIPFATMLRGAMETSAQGLAQSLFIYSALLWLVQKMRGNLLGAAMGLAIWATLLELTQMTLLGRTADVTEPLLVLLVAGGLAIGSKHTGMPRAPALTKHEATHIEVAAPLAILSYPPWWVVPALSVFCLSGLFWLGLRLPGIPYNVRDLFLGDGNIFALSLFALALLWIGAGAMWGGKYIADKRHPYLSLPAWCIGASLVSLLLLSASVTQESLDDIAGSNNLYWYVTNRNIWGDAWRDFFSLVGPNFVGVFERLGRFTALYTPPFIFMALMINILHSHLQNRVTWRGLVLRLMSALPWLWLAKAVAFDWSSTDNLNELIARDGLMGLGGGGYLYALLGLLCLNAVLLGYTRGARLVALLLAFSIAMLPVGWWLLNLGLEANVEKYNLFFSGAQFLLGPDRAHLLSEASLFMRWCVLQLGFVVVAAVGMRVAALNPRLSPRSSAAV